MKQKNNHKINKHYVDFKLRNRRLAADSRKTAKVKVFLRNNSRLIVILILIFWLAISVFPFIWGIIASFNSYTQISNLGINPLPNGKWTTENFDFLFNDPFTKKNIGIWLRNSLIFSIGTGLTNMIFNFLAGYALARIAFKGKKLYLWYMILGMMIPAQITQVPQLIMLIKMGVIGNKASDSLFFMGILFSSMTSASWVFMVRQFYINLGASSEEAAQLDGLSTFGVFWKISLKQMIPLMATMFTLVFMASWNNFVMFTLWAGSDSDRMNFVTGLQTIGDIAAPIYGPNFSLAITLAATNIAILPVIAVYFISLYFQKKQIIEGEK